MFGAVPPQFSPGHVCDSWCQFGANPRRLCRFGRSCRLISHLLSIIQAIDTSWHGRGHRFDPGQVHQYILQKKQCNAKVSVKAGFFYVHRSGLAALLREVRSNWGVGSTGWIAKVAERQGFEPWIPCGIHAFQACALSHSAISPLSANLYESTTASGGDGMPQVAESF